MDAMRDVSATETAIIYGLEPVWGAGFAWFLLGERWSSLGWIGAALVLGKLTFCFPVIIHYHTFQCRIAKLDHSSLNVYFGSNRMVVMGSLYF